MDRILSGLYGAGDEDDEPTRVSKAQDFVSRVESGDKAEGYSTEEAVKNYQNVTMGLSDDEFEQVAEDALRQLTPEQRREFTHVIKQQAGIDIDDNMDDAHELASLTKQFRSSSSGDFGGLLGGLLGGGGTGGVGSDDIMGVLGGLLGGGGMPGATGTAGASSTQAGLSGLLGNPIVKMVLGLIAAQAMKKFMGGGGGGGAQTNPFGGSQPRQTAGSVSQDRGSNDSGGGGILDALFGGGDDNTPQERARQDRNQDSGGGLLDALFGGGDDDANDNDRRSTGDKKVDVSRIERDRKSKGL